MNKDINYIERDLQDQLQSVEARSDIEMGYTKEQVLDSLRKINELRPGMSFSCFH
jgi:hypothetical protein